jgi:hypothetical protein
MPNSVRARSCVRDPRTGPAGGCELSAHQRLAVIEYDPSRFYPSLDLHSYPSFLSRAY